MNLEILDGLTIEEDDAECQIMCEIIDNANANSVKKEFFEISYSLRIHDMHM